MPSRRPPSQRDPAYALHRLPGQVRQILPGVQVKNASPVKQTSSARKAAAGGPVLFVSIAADGPPTDGSVLWYVTDESC